jgi:IS5 family transposase
MLCDRYAPQDLFTQIPGRCLQFEPVLAQLDRLLEDDTLFQRVKADLAKRRPHTLTRGRHSTPVEVLLRMLVVMRLYGWSFAQTEYFVQDSLTLRQFCRVYWARVPDDTVLIRWAALVGPETLAALNARVVKLATQAKVTRGRQLRVDTTVIETNIHPPADSSLLTDGVRVLGRLLKRAQPLLGEGAAQAKTWFRDRTRSLRQRSSQLRRLYRSRGRSEAEKRAARQQIYGGLLQIARRSRAQGEKVLAALRERAAALGETAGKAGKQAAQLAQQLAGWLPKLGQAIDQARRRVLWGEQVPASDKIVSLFESHTQIISRGKAGNRVEFGRKLLLEEVEGGLISGYAVLPEANADAGHFPESLARHQEQFGRPPALATADRGFATAANREAARKAGVKRLALPYVGKAPPEAKEPWFRAGYRWRAGMEGRISLLGRRFGLKRARYPGERGLCRWVGWGILAHNLWQTGRVLAARQAS